MTGWSDRQRVGTLALSTALLTGAAVAAIGASAPHLIAAGLYVVTAAVALLVPSAIPVQVVGGQLLAGSILLAPDRPAPLLLLPVVASIVVTAELLASAGRLDTPVEPAPRDDLRRAGVAAVIGGAVYGAVVLAGRLPGPTGLPAIALASAACLVLAILLVRNTGRVF